MALDICSHLSCSSPPPFVILLCVIGQRKIPRYAATLLGLPNILRYLLFKHWSAARTHTHTHMDTHIWLYTHNNYHWTADKGSCRALWRCPKRHSCLLWRRPFVRALPHYKTLVVIHANNSLSDSGGELKVGAVLMECFGHGVSLVRESLDPYILLGTISLSLSCLSAAITLPMSKDACD